MITYKGIVAYFDAICDRHQQIQSFTYGEIDLFDKDKFTMYPALHLTPTGTAIDDQTVVYGFDVVVFDRYNVASNKMRNEAQCLSDSLLILQDICKELTDGKYFINEDTLISMDMPIVAQPFIDTEPDNCSGWSTSFNVITPNEASACSIPYFLSETQNALTVTVPDTLTTFAWWSREQIHSKANFSGQELTSLSPIIDNVSGSDVLTMIGSSVTWSPLKNAFKMYDVSTTTAMNLQHPAITETEATFFLRIKDFGRFAAAQQNQICYFGDVGSFTNGFYIYMDTTAPAGKLSIVSWTDFDALNSEFAVVPTNGTSGDTQHRRLEPLTMCIQVTTNKIILWYGMSTNEKIEMSSVFEFDSSVFGIGHPSVNQMSDFYLQEYVYVPEGMSNADITQTMQWLNYR